MPRTKGQFFQFTDPMDSDDPTLASWERWFKQRGIKTKRVKATHHRVSLWREGKPYR